MKFKKSAICIILAFAMLVSMSVCSFAAAPADMDVVAGEITFYKTPSQDHPGEYVIESKCLVRDLTGQGREAILIAAAYDDEGNLIDTWGNPTARGSDGILNAWGVTDDRSTTIKAFVWDPETNKPLTPVAIYKDKDYDMDAVLSKLKITFDGVDFATYMEAAFDPATTTYTKALDAGSKLPTVKATVNDNAADVIVVTQNNKTTITVDHSAGYENKTVTGTVPSGTTANVQRADYGNWTRTYTINYTGSDLVPATQPADTLTCVAPDATAMAKYLPDFVYFDYNTETGASDPGSKFWHDTVWHAFKSHNVKLGLRGLMAIQPSWNLINDGAYGTNNGKSLSYVTTKGAPYYSFKVNQPSEILVFVHSKPPQTSNLNYYANCCPESEKADWVTIRSEGVTGDYDYLWADDLTHSAGVNTTFGAGTTLSVKYAAEGETVTIYSPGNAWLPYYVFVRPLS